MNFKNINLSEKRTALIGTLILHLIGIVVMLIYTIGSETVTFAGSVELGWGGGIPEQSMPKSKPAVARPLTRAERRKLQHEKKALVKLPQRKFAEKSKPLIEREDKQANQIVSSANTVEELTKRKTVSNVDQIHSDGENTNAHPEKLSNTDGTGNPEGNGEVGYSVAWNGGGTRKLLQGDLPQYPHGANVKAQVKIQVTVLPNGSVEKCVPIQTADRRLVDAAIVKTRNWRFDALKQTQRQVKQKCVVTFNFKLE